MNMFANFPAGAILIAIGPILLLAFTLVPSGWANRHPARMTHLASGATLATLGMTLLGVAAVAVVGRIESVVAFWLPFSIGVYFDVLSAIMFLVVAFLGAVVTRYAFNYLKGDAQQGHFLKWLCVTLGAVLTLIISSNLVMFTAAWIATSLSLHQLLTFYKHRPSARMAARKKFVISRMGDVCLLVAIVLVYRAFGSWEFGDLFAQAAALRSNGQPAPPELTAICLLLASGAMLKSAQFPFHSWLPDTMETPTPVSALMHAGIINAGGFLIVRLSPVISLSPLTLDVLAIVGAFTAIFASLVMMTQASIKRMLAFSTIAQMGFMLLQCGLGAFSVAVLHIVAHSLYKAHAFLSSGSVVSISKTAWVPVGRPTAHVGVLVAALLVAVGLTFGVALIVGVSPLAEPGAVILGTVFIMGLTHLLWSLWGQSVTPGLVAAGLLIGVIVSAAYFVLHIVFKTMLASALPYEVTAPTVNSGLLIPVLIALFGAVLVLQSQLPLWASREWCRRLYVHARNGFYFNTLANRAVQSFWPAR